MLTYTTPSGEKYKVHLSPLDIAIPLHFGGSQPNSYGVPFAKSEAFEGGGFIGDVRRGGSCNFEIYTFIPHCNGTHTECVGHISHERISIHSYLKDAFIPATLITITPHKASETQDTYIPEFNPNDIVIDKTTLEAQLKHIESPFKEGLIIRTLPNPASKMYRDYTKHDAPFFTIEAMKFIRSIGVKHLLVDIPSVDRMFDEGKLSAHHLYFEIPFGENTVQKPVNYTITEFIFVSPEIPDGIYLLNLQIAAFMSDASPSRPLIFRLSREDS